MSIYGTVMAAYNFPISVEDNNYKAKVTFTPITLQSYDVTSVFSSADPSRVTNNESADPAFNVRNPNNIQSSSVSGGQRSAQEATRRLQNIFNFLGSFNTTIAGTGQQIEQVHTGRSISLYLPQAVQITDAAQYDNVNLGIVGAGTLAGVEAGLGISKSLGEGVANTLTDIYKAFNTDGLSSTAGRLAQARAAQMFLPNNGAFQGAVRSGTRVAVNPNTRALFRAIPLREFTFTFKMIPNSKAEHAEIKNIIRIFREELYPVPIEVSSSGGSVSIAAGYEYPNVFDITFSYNNINNAIATRILPSYLRNFSVTYNSSGMGFHEDGDFTEVDVSMSFVEGSALNRNLVEEGY